MPVPVALPAPVSDDIFSNESAEMKLNLLVLLLL